MPTYQVAWNATTRDAKVQNDGDAVGGGYTDIGSFDHHDDADDEQGDDGGTGTENHVYFHHVQELLYQEGVENMQNITITAPKPEGISSVIADDTLTVAQESQITTTFDPVTTTDKRLTYATSDATKATVSASGLVTGVAAGAATITITSSADTRLTDTVDVTVS
jgi:hypothetical protein